MSHTGLSDNAKAELACAYAALALHDDGVEITADKLSALVKAAGVNIPAVWTSLFAKALSGKNVEDLLMAGGGGGGAAAPAGDAKEEKKDDKKGKKKEEAKEESEDEGFGG